MNSDTSGRNSPLICSPNLLKQCPGSCGLLHASEPVLWKLEIGGSVGWANVLNGALIEEAYSHPSSDFFELQARLGVGSVPYKEIMIRVEFQTFLAEAHTPPCGKSFHKLVRLDCGSYALLNAPIHATIWTWYYNSNSSWLVFGEHSPAPLQCVLESKFLAGQEVYRYELDSDQSEPEVVLIHFRSMRAQSLSVGWECEIRRRPRHGVPPPTCPTPPYAGVELPADWVPLDTQHEFELVPLNPNSLSYHLVASEFSSTMETATIRDVFRLQNVHLWHKFLCKKKYLESKKGSANERLLFHGTPDKKVVQSIFSQNVDPRCYGVHATVYGKGAYFAERASLSDKYSGRGGNHVCWMFCVRVLLGETTLGNRDYTRPPAKDDDKPHGDRYDSCVDDTKKPKIFVIFDSDQCYPEYVICYTREANLL